MSNQTGEPRNWNKKGTVIDRHMVKKMTISKTITAAAVVAVAAVSILGGCSGAASRTDTFNSSAGSGNEAAGTGGVDPWDILKEVPETGDGNKLVSKTSLDSALSLAGMGMSSGAGKADIETFTGIKLTEDGLRRHNVALNNDMVKSANGIFVSDDYMLSEDFAGLAQKIGMAAEGYRSKKEGMEAVNNFVNTNTDGMIKQGVTSLDEIKDVMLVNTLYFDGLWDFTWDSEEQVPFYGIKKRTKTTFFRKNMDSYYEADGWYGIKLDYEGGRYSMYAAMPKKGSKNPESRMTNEQFQNLFQNEVFADVRIFFPAFTFDTGCMDLTELVKEMCQGAFSKLNLVAGNSARLDSILQKAKIEVTKEGTRAAAVTIGAAEVTSVRPSEPKEIRFDHPFVFAITDTETGEDLFNGALKTIS